MADLVVWFHPWRKLTLQATARWLSVDLGFDCRVHTLGDSDDNRTSGLLAINNPLGSTEEDWILVTAGVVWRF